MILVRSALFNAWFFAATFLVGLGASGLRWVGKRHALKAAQLWAGLVLAGLCSDGITEVADVHHVDRGYPDFVEQLRGLGATIERTHRDRDT